MQALQQGEASGCWCLGSRTAHVGGVLVWLRRERHVVELVAKGGWETLGEVFRESSQAAPWLRYVVGAPKKGAAKAKSRRGQHLTREGRAARAQRELEAPASATEPVEGRAEAAAVSSGFGAEVGVAAPDTTGDEALARELASADGARPETAGDLDYARELAAAEEVGVHEVRHHLVHSHLFSRCKLARRV